MINLKDFRSLYIFKTQIVFGAIERVTNLLKIAGKFLNLQIPPPPLLIAIVSKSTKMGCNVLGEIHQLSLWEMGARGGGERLSKNLIFPFLFLKWSSALSKSAYDKILKLLQIKFSKYQTKGWKQKTIFWKLGLRKLVLRSAALGQN